MTANRPQDDARVTDALRRSLHEEASRIEPTSRLGAVLDAAHAAQGDGDGTAVSGPGVGSARGRWLGWLVAAAVALIVGGVAIAGRTLSNNPAPSPASQAASGTTATTTAAPSTASASTTTAGPTSSAPAPVGTSFGLAVYTVGANVAGSASGTPVLVRTFLPVTAPSASVTDKACAAVTRAAAEAAGAAGTPWAGVTCAGVQSSGAAIAVALTGPGAPVGSPAAQRLAVAALAFTAQAAIGQGDLPVTFTTPSGAPLLGSIDPAQPWTRAALGPDVLANIWVNQPYAGQVLPVGTPVTVTGEARVFEAALQWEVRRAGSVVAHGLTTASIGAPGRGTYSVTVGALPAGSYELRVFDLSAKDGSIADLRTVPFAVG